jgi:hypothetical protein
MTADNQTIENPDPPKNLDIDCQVTWQHSLKDLSDAYNTLESGKEIIKFFNSDYNKFAERREAFLVLSGRHHVENLPSVDILSHLELPNFSFEEQISQTVFHLLTHSMNKSAEALTTHCNQIDSELERLQQSQASEMQSAKQGTQASKMKLAQDSIDYAREEISTEKERIDELAKSILIEGAFLFAAFVVGMVSGIGGALIVTIGVLIWRCNII